MKKILTLLIITATLLCNLFSYADESPNFNVGRNQSIPDLVAGEENHLPISFINDSRASIERLEIIPKFNSEDDYPFVINEVSTVLTKHSIDSKERFTMHFYLEVKKTAEAGKYPLVLDLNYKTWDGMTGSQTETLYLDIVNGLKQPDIDVTDINVESGILTSGTTKKVDFTLKNTSDLILTDVKIGFKNLSAETIQIAGQKDETLVKSIASKGIESVSFDMVAGSGLSGSYQDVIGLISFTDEYHKKYEIEKTLRVPVEDGANYDADLSITNVSLPSYGINSGTEFPLEFSLVNNDLAELKNVTIKIESDSGIYTKSSPTVHFREFTSGDSKVVNFQLDSKSDIEAKSHSLKVLVNYEIAGNKKEYYEYLSVPIQQSGGNLSPKLILTDYKINKEQVFAGQEFPVSFQFTNTSKSKEIYNIKITISSTENTFTPVESSNVFFIDKLNSKQNITKDINLKSDYNAKPQNHVIELKMEYEDKEGKEYSTSDTVSIPVLQELKPRVSKVDIPEFLQVGAPINLSFDIYNIGKADIKNIFVEVIGEGLDDTQGETYLGNLSEGSDTYYDGSIIFEEEGSKSATIVIKYQDDAGNEFKYTKDIEMTIEAGFNDEFNGEFGGEFGNEFGGEYGEGVNTSSIPWVKIAIAIVLLALIVFAVIKFRKKRKVGKQVEQYDPMG